MPCGISIGRALQCSRSSSPAPASRSPPTTPPRPVTLIPSGDAIAVDEGFPGDGTTDGVFVGTGFGFSASTPDDDLGDPFIGTIYDGGPTGFANLADALQVSREDGGAFDLLSLDITEPFVADEAIYSGVGADGSFIDSEPVAVTIEDFVELTGLKADGTVVRTTYDPRSPDLGSGLTRLTSLTLSLADVAPDFCSPLNLALLDPSISTAPLCEGVEVEPPFYDTAFDTVSGLNYDYDYGIAAITVEPAPIPVPATLPLLLGGLGALALGARRAARRRR